MKPIKPKDVGAGNYYDCVTGSIDDVININGEEIIVDKKTASKIPDSPADGYVVQINIYKLLYFIQSGIEVKKGAILYLDKTKSFKDPICYVFDLWDIKKIQAFVIDKLDKLKSGVPPDRVVSGLCNYCPFIKVCDPFLNGGLRK